MPSSTKWRINISVGNGPTWLGIASLTMHTTVGGADVCTGGTASANSVSGGFEASKAFDSNTSTYWSTASGTTGWLQYEFASSVNIVGYTVRAESTASYAPRTWTFEYWDGSTWQVFDTQTNHTGWRASQLRSFPIISKMQWRINVTANYGVPANSFTTLGEIQFRIVASGANQASVSTQVFADSIDTSNVPERAIDGSATTFWSSSATFPHWWLYWFTSPVDIVEYMIRADTTYYNQYVPKTWTFEYYDGSTWVVVDTRTNESAWTSGETRTYTVTPAVTAPVESIQFSVVRPD